MITRRGLLIFAAAAACLALGAPAPHATTPGTNGRIAFSQYRLHDAPLQAEIFAVNSDGTRQRKLTHASRGFVDDEPDWAPGGSRLVFQRCGSPGPPCSIWTVNADGSGLRRLSPRCSQGSAPPKCPDDSGPAFSPNGRQIAFTRFHSAKSGGQIVMVADANLRHAHPLGPGWEPGWSPDGNQLAFVWKPGNRQGVFVENADGTGRHRVTPWRLRAGEFPDWSPDGTRILFNTGGPDRGNLFTIRPDGTGLRQLTHFRGLSKVVNGSFSPDGDSIVFATQVGAVNPSGASLPDIFVMSADGTDIRPVTRSRNYDASPDWGRRR